MLLPLMSARMEKPDNSSGTRIASRNVRSLVIVAEKTSQRQVASGGLAVVFARNDMVDLKREVVVFLRHLAVLTNAPGATPNQTFEAKVHSHIQ
jgi:hypothetical protein